MLGISIDKILLTLVLGYIAYNSYIFYGIFNPTQCTTSQDCVYPTWNLNDEYVIHVKIFGSGTVNLVDSIVSKPFKTLVGFESVYNVTVPPQIYHNGSAYCEILIFDEAKKVVFKKSTQLSSYRLPKSKAINLLNSDQQDLNISSQDPVTYWLSILQISVLNKPISFHVKAIPQELHSKISIYRTGTKLSYSLLFYVNPDLQSTTDWVEISNSKPNQPIKRTLLVKIDPMSIGKFRLRCLLEQTMEQFKNFGFKENDIEAIQGIFTDTNLYLLLTTVVIAALHMFFDFLAFKNEIQFWRRTENTAGISIRVIIWRCVSTTTIFLYLYEEKSSLLILIPSGISVIIEIWKLLRMSKIDWSFSGGLVIGDRNDQEKETDKLDAQFMHWLMILMTPLCLGGAIYSLLYMPHRSWISWILQTCVNGVYAFGFLLMTPQLFINYRLKSVANMPWRALTYKAFNTFIDDFFAFIIKMPTAHRIACFRDDIIFIIYLVQLWLYPVDFSRVNEFGQCVETENICKPNDKKQQTSSKIKKA